MKLFTGPVSLFGKKVEIAAYEKNIALDIEWVPFTLKDYYQDKHPEVVRINPKQQVPVLIDGDLEIFDSTQILEYFENKFPETPLWPRDIQQRAKARLLELVSDEIIFGQLIGLVNGGATISDEEKQDIIKATLEQYSQLDQRLQDQEYFFKDFSIADIAIYCSMTLGQFYNINIPEHLSKLQAWRKRMNKRESVQKATKPMLAFIEKERER